MSLLVLSSSDVDALTASLTPSDLLALSAQVFCAFSSSSSASPSEAAPARTTQPPRMSLPTTNHTLLIMPASLSLPLPPSNSHSNSNSTSTSTSNSNSNSSSSSSSSSNSNSNTCAIAGTKLVSAPRTRAAPAGLPASTLLLDARTGRARALVNARRLTALRNAGGSLLSTHLVRPLKSPGSSPTWPRTLVALGAGLQVSAHLALFVRAHAASVRRCAVFNRTRARAEGLCASLRAAGDGDGGEVEWVVGTLPGGPGGEEEEERYREALRGADIIIAATPSTAPLVRAQDVKPGAHICLVGSYTSEMHEVDTALVRRAGTIMVDSKEACLREAGELIAAKFTAEDLVEIGELVSIGEPAHSPAHASHSPQSSWHANHSEITKRLGGAGDITIFKSVGLGVQDVGIAWRVVERAEELGDVGTRVAYDD